MNRVLAAGLVAAWVLAACANTEDKATTGDVADPSAPTPSTNDVADPIADPMAGGVSGLPPGTQVVVPIDERPVAAPDVAPPPISGGTLLVTDSGRYAVASDPDRDRIVIVDMAYRVHLWNVALEPGDEPGRLTEDDAGRVHVALRSAGAVVTIDPASGDILERRDVCGSPRGITYDVDSGMLHVACAQGELVTLAPEGAAPMQRAALGTDLRDVVVQNGRTFVSHFRAPQVTQVAAGSAATQAEPPLEYVHIFDAATGSQIVDAFSPTIAWRTIEDPSIRGGGTIMVHQMARLGEIELPDVEEDGTVVIEDAGNASYGGGADGCSGVVHGAISSFDEDGTLKGTVRSPMVLPVDIAADSRWMVVVQAGTLDPLQPVRQFAFPDGSGGSIPLPIFPSPSGPFPGTDDVLLFDRVQIESDMEAKHQGGSGCTFPFTSMDVPGQAVAAAFAPDGAIVIQSREPATISIGDAGNSFLSTNIDLGGEPMLDTGHEIFHRNAGSGIACASCHPEGAEDSHTWTFAGFGPRRTQPLHVGLRGTEPFHWEGDKRDMSMLMADVLVARMGGVHESPERTAALERWLYTLTPPAPVRAADDTAAARGHALFEGAAECATCHSGAVLTNNETVDVGTGGEFQVPSLVGVAHRAPFVHTGCASTLRERFDPSCGGDNHGKIDTLTDSQIDDLVAYLETL